MVTHAHHHLRHHAIADESTGVIVLMIIVLLTALLGIGTFLYAQNIYVRLQPAEETPTLNGGGEIYVPMPLFQPQ